MLHIYEWININCVKLRIYIRIYFGEKEKIWKKKTINNSSIKLIWIIRWKIREYINNIKIKKKKN